MSKKEFFLDAVSTEDEKGKGLLSDLVPIL